MLNHNFLNLLKFSKVPELDDYNEEEACMEIDYWLAHPNDSIYDTIDYEKLIFIEMRFKDNLDLLLRLDELKAKISENYINRKRLIHRLALEKPHESLPEECC